MKAQTSTLPKDHEIKEKWYIIDAEGLILGRVAARIAALLRGKTLPTYTPHLDPKIHVIVTNADKIVLTGDKATTKVYQWHTRYRTGLKTATPEKILAGKKPEDVLRKAVHGMLPKNRLGRALDRHVRLYKAGEYTGQHAAQQPETLVLRTRQPRAAK